MQHRKPLPDDRQAVTKRFSIPYDHEDDGTTDALHAAIVAEMPEIDRVKLDAVFQRVTSHTKAPSKLKFYVTAGFYPDGGLGEVFIRADRVGSFMAGALDMTAMVMSIALQYGVPLDAFASKMRYSKFPPNGLTGDSEFRMCSSPFDLLANYLTARFGPKPIDGGTPTPPTDAPSPTLENL